MIAVYAAELRPKASPYTLAPRLRLDIREHLSKWEMIKPERFSEKLQGLLLLQAMLLKADIDPCGRRLGIDPLGRPYLTDLPIDFNLSHSKDLLVCALETRTAWPMRVGVDAEKCIFRSIDSMVRLSERFFTPEEQRSLLSFPTERSFLRIWTAKEAIVKQSGQGISALQSADSDNPPEGQMLMHYTLPGAEVTLCHNKNDIAPKTIEFLSTDE